MTANIARSKKQLADETCISPFETSLFLEFGTASSLASAPKPGEINWLNELEVRLLQVYVRKLAKLPIPTLHEREAI